MRLRWIRFLLILGLWHLLRSASRTRKLLRQLPIPEKATDPETWEIPRELTGVRVPLRLKGQTAVSLRCCLEDQVIWMEQVAQRMRDLIGMVSTSLRTRSRSSESRS
jgi:hypothetical protein